MTLLPPQVKRMTKLRMTIQKLSWMIRNLMTPMMTNLKTTCSVPIRPRTSLTSLPTSQTRSSLSRLNSSTPANHCCKSRSR